ncbi:protein kinase [Sorangium atrum]|uniref:Protein kinase n=1 Tax=Sorangium atrum TaxID=2995308 RepID=A0ABT5CHJ8_9BACT|nr:protein kinase [Sorangium aterium]MDC0685916.1 protein kinase [Sorangium aterium]
MVEPGTVWEGHRILNEVHDGMVRTFLAQQVGDEAAIVWLHLREGQPMDRTAFASELQRLQDIARAVPQVEPVLYGDAGGLSAWVAYRRSDKIGLMDAIRGVDLGVTALHTVIEVAHAIQRCHTLGGCHGALGSDRVFITSKRDYSISQFGLVGLFRIEPHEAAREPLVASPELLRGDRVRPQTDVYGLGTLLYELVCRRSLDVGQPGMLGVRRGRPAIPVDTPPAVAAAIEMALEEDPRRRYRNVGHFIAVLEGLVDAWPTLDRAPSRRDNHAPVAGAAPSTLRSSHLQSRRLSAPVTEAPDTRTSEVAPVAAPSSDDEHQLPQIPPLDGPSPTAPASKEPVTPPPPSLRREPGGEPMMVRSDPVAAPPHKLVRRLAIPLAATAALCAGALCLTPPAGIASRAEKLGTMLVERASPRSGQRRLPSPEGAARADSKEADSRPRAAYTQRTGVTAKAELRRPYCEAGDFSCGPAMY